MSTPEEPRYGRRSANWQPEQSQQGQSPWPQYGQAMDSSASPTGDPYGAGQAGVGQQAPYQPAPYGQMPYGYPGVPGGVAPLPKRTGSILTIIVGAFLSFIMAPIVLVALVISGSGVFGMVGAAEEMGATGTVTVTESGAYAVSPMSVDVYACTLTDASGKEHRMEQAAIGRNFQIAGLQPGQYALKCEGEGDFRVIGMPMPSPTDSAAIGTRAFAWATVVGLLGLALLIYGIIRLRKVNRRRREILMGYRPM